MTVAFPLDNSHVWLLQNICSAYKLCIHFTQIYMYFVKTKFFKVFITGSHCLPLVLLWMTCLPSYFHLSTLNTICCLINHKDLILPTPLTTAPPGNSPIFLYCLIFMCACDWSKWNVDLFLPDEGEDSECIIRSCKKFIGVKGRQPSFSQQWVSTGLVVQRWQKAGAVVLENASVSDV